MTNLSVNVNKIALIRNSRKGEVPCLENFSRICIENGAKGITVHPRPDLRHIRPDDLELISKVTKELSVEFNIEGNPFEKRTGDYPGFLNLVENFIPTQCTLVPDASNQLTSDHGWNVLSEKERLIPIIQQLKSLGIRTVLFIDHDIDQIEAAKNIGVDRVEIYTGPFAKAFKNNDLKIIDDCKEAISFSKSINLDLNAGHDLSLLNIEKFLSLGEFKEVSIGHALVSEALISGLSDTIKEYIKLTNPK
jgi:pyridoxine 5-phosphate synthase